MKNLWLIFLAGGALTFLTRFSFIYFLRKTRISPVFERLLRLLPVAALSAMIAPQLFYADQGFTLLGARSLAGLAATLVAWRTRSVVWTLAAGMAVLWLFPLFTAFRW